MAGRNRLITSVVCLIYMSLCLRDASGHENGPFSIEDFVKNNRHKLRPVCEDNAPVQVKIGLAIKQIIDLNEPRQILETNAWIRLEWYDCHVKWNATSTGLDSVVVPYGTIWVPDITLYDNAENELGGLKDYRQYIVHNGTIQYNFPTIVKSLCTVDVTYFPFDIQVCRFKFGSWMHDVMELNLSKTADSGDVTIYRSNGEWQILGAPAIRHEKKYLCCKNNFSDVTFYLQLKRRPLFYMLNLMFPCCLISTVAILSFLLPPESGEKVSLCITVLLSLAVFLLVVSESMPPTSETFPYIGLYFACCMLLVSVSCLMTVTVLNFHHKGNRGRKVPYCVRKVFLDFFGTILCQRSNMHSFNHRGMKSRRQAVYTIDRNSTVQTHDIPNGVVEHGDTSHGSIKNISERQVTNIMGGMHSSMEILILLQKQVDSLYRIASRAETQEELEQRVGEWQMVAKVIDRIFFTVFLCIQIGTSLGVLVRISTAERTLSIE